MPQKKILIDTNTYIRLSKDIHPLLGEVFGDQSYCLYILKEAYEELQNPRLETSFYWIEETEYVENRKKFPSISRVNKREIKDNFQYMWETAQEPEFIGPSETDIIYLATALALEIPVVTDDQAMVKLGLEYGIEVMSTVKLLKLMHDSNHITLEEVDRIVKYLNVYDRPSNLHEDYKKYFDKTLVSL